MAFTNSSLVTYKRLSPNTNIPRNQPISKITIHHMAGVNSVEGFGDIVASSARAMSSNYAIGNDGRIGLYCEERNRSWCSSSPWNDNKAVTIEVSNSAYGDATGWPVSNAAYTSLIKLCVDICQRNGIKKLEFTGDQYGSLTYHYMFNNTQCLPVDRTELLTPTGWRKLSDIHIGDMVATAHIDDVSIEFDEVQNIVPIKTQDTYVMRDFEATSDHRIMYYNQAGRQYIGLFKDIYDAHANLYLPNAGQLCSAKGFGDLSLTELEFLIAVQADGHYMYDNGCYFGIEFHLRKERKINRITAILDELGYPHKSTIQSDGTTKLRVYGKKYYQFCEKFLQDKHFTWDWLNMTKEQADFFLKTILLYDGCEANLSYSSYVPINLDVVQAIASINGVGSKVYYEDNRLYFKKNLRSLGSGEHKRKPRQKVSCVTVKSGFILIRQYGRTTITGNCPGDWIKNHTQDICNKVNAELAKNPSLIQLQNYTQTVGENSNESAFPTSAEYALTGSLVSVEPDYKEIKSYMVTLNRSVLNVNYEALRGIGVIGVMIDVGNLYDGSHMEVPYFKAPNLEKQVEAAKKAEMPYAFFTTVRARNINEANAELKWLRIYIQKYTPTLGVWLKLEFSATKVMNDMILDRYKTLLTASGLKGKMGFYVTRNQLATLTWSKWQEDYMLWLVDPVKDISEIEQLLTPEFFDL